MCADVFDVSEQAGCRQDVWEYSAATSSGGAAEAGGKHQEDFRQSGRRGYQGESEPLPHPFSG